MVTFYTDERGRVEAAASGIGKPGSSLSAAVEPFALSRLHFAEGRGADRLTQCRVIESFYELRRDLPKFAHASAACELVLRTTETDQIIPGLFEMLVSYLREMTVSDSPQVLSWAFQLAYLDMSGLGPVLDRCVECGCALSAGVYSAARGGLVCERCAGGMEDGLPLSAGTVQSVAAISTFHVKRLARLRLTERTRREVEALLRSHIRYHLDLTLKSEAFLRKLPREE
jgi:DNA repair protein RecO (recombination protein O)